MILGEQPADEAQFIKCELQYEDETVRIPIVVYSDGTIFHPWDWQGECAATPSEIRDYDWTFGKTGKKAIILNGLPRIL